MIKKALMLAIVSALITAGMAQTVFATPHVENISLKKQGEFVEMTIYADGPFTFSHFIEEAKAGKPYRVIVDLKQCLHQLPQFNFRELPTGVITSIRTSQYKIKPDKVVRIVADVTRPVTYTLKQGEGRITLVFAAPEEKEFEFWCAAPLSESEKINLALADSKTKPVDQPALMPANPEAEKKAADAGTFTPPPVSNKNLDQEKQAVKQQPAESKTETRTGLTADERHALKQQLAQSLEQEPQTPVPASESKVQKSEQAVKPEPKKPVKMETAQVSDQEESAATRIKQGGETEKAPVVKKETSDKKAYSDSQAVKPLVPVEDSDQGTETAAPVKPSTPSDEGEEGRTKEWKSEKDLRKNPERPPKVTGSLAAAFPKREIVRYRSYGRRDPFQPLVSKSLSGFQSGQLPDVETLRLVGVLQGDYTNMALLEDMEGYGYILENGDKVKNGYVIEIYENKILFQLSEFGWSRSVALSMDMED